MPSWNDSNANLPDRESAIRAELAASGGTVNLSQVLANGAGAGGSKITGLGDPTSAQDAATKNYVDTHGGGGGGGLSTVAITFSQPGALVTGTGTMRWLCPWNTATIQGTVAAVGTAPTGASLICDVKKNGTTIYSTSANRPTIAVSANATSGQPTPDVTSLASGDYLTVDIDQVGSTISGADLTVVISLIRTS